MTISPGIGSNIFFKKKVIVLPPKIKQLKVISNGNGAVSLRWNKQSGIHGYSIMRAQGGNRFKYIKDIFGSSKTTYTDTGLKRGMTYYYCVCGFIKYKKVLYIGEISNVIQLTVK